MTILPISTLKIGGLTKSQLIEKLQQQSIAMNEYAQTLFMDDNFNTSGTAYSLQIVDITVEELGFSDGVTLPEIYERAIEHGLKLCPLELGPYLRLAYLEQPEGNLDKPSSKNQAPYGSITVASETLREDDDFPKGFYLRKMNGVLWLRGYIADNLHNWSPGDRFIFCRR